MKGMLYLIPNTLGDPDTGKTIPIEVSGIATILKVFIVEDIRNARRYLKKLDPGIDIDSLTFLELNEHTPPGSIPQLLTDLEAGISAGIISEAGIPGIADPGTSVVRLAHERGIRVIPLTGPSSIFLALMASGLNGQNFRFTGYLPINRKERINKLHELEKIVLESDESQIFMETPYRNDALLEDILNSCKPDTLLTVAVDITLKSEEIRTYTIKNWRSKKLSLHKRPAVFILGR